MGPTGSPAVFDNFNRTTTNPYWGTSTAGYGWATYNWNNQCSGYTGNVNGTVGVMTGSAGATCIVGGNDQLIGDAGPWTSSSWQFTGKFKVSAIDNGYAAVDIATNANENTIVGVGASFSTSSGQLYLIGGGGAAMTFAWQANTWYQVKWAVVWGDQQRLKVWTDGSAEPTEWMLSSTAPAYDSASNFEVFWFENSAATSSYWDDFSFGPAPILPKLPPPPETDRNSPDPNSGNGGDPVSTFTGAYGYRHTDMSIAGRGPAISFARAYNSNDTRTTTLGPGWTHSYNLRLYDPGDGSSDVVLVGPQGRSDRYASSGGSFTPPPGVHRLLVQNADLSYTATDKDQTVWQFDASGVLTQILDRYGNASRMTYDTSGRLTRVSDPAGRGSLSLGYTNELLTSVTDWASPARSVSYQYDASGRLWKVTDREGKTTTYGYNGTSSRLTTITDARGSVAITLTYDANGRVATQKDAHGASTGDETTFGYVVNGDGTRVTTVTMPTTSFEPAFHPTIVDSYDASGWLSQRVSHPSSTETLTPSYTYDGAGNRASVTDARGNRTDYCYDVDYAGRAIAGSAGNLTRVIAPAPATGAMRPVTLTAYDARNNVIETVSPKGAPSGSTISCATNLSSVNAAYASDYAYDASGENLLSVTTRYTDPDTGAKTAVTKYEYGDGANAGRVTRIIPPRGNTTGSPDYTYATTMTYFGTGTPEAGMLDSVTDPLGNKTTFDYDNVGRLTARVDPLGDYAIGAFPGYHTTSFTYDKEDRVRTESLPGPLNVSPALVTETRYDGVGNPVVKIDANGQVTTYSYDERDALHQVKESASVWTDPATPPADVTTTEYTYDAAGNLARTMRAKGDAANERATDYAFDGRNLVRTETQYPSWPTTSPTLVTSTTYDAGGNVATLVDPLGKSTTNGYDALNRLTSIDYSDPSTPDVAYGYDANGNRTSMTDGTGSTTYTYDEANRLTAVTSPGPKTVGYRYDLDGNRTKLIYPDSSAVTYTFNKGSQLSSLSDWASRSVAYTYWPDGLVKTASNPDGTVAGYGYDNARRATDVAHTSSSGQYLDRSFYTLDKIGDVTGVNHGTLAAQVARPDGTTGSNGAWTGSYTSINEAVPNDSTFLASPSGPTSANYYEVSLSDVQPPMDITGIKFHYRVAKSGNNSGQTIGLNVELRQGSTVIYTASYQSLPGVTGSGWLDDTATVSHQTAQLITNFNDLRIRFTPSSSGSGQKRQAEISWLEFDVPSPADPTKATSYVYDGLGRLTSVTGVGGPASYAYDPVGNRTSATVAGTPTTYTYDSADRMTAAGGSNVSVDADGNLTAHGTSSYGFDQANRLTTAYVSGATETYAYNGDGQRASRTVGGGSPIGYVNDPAIPLWRTLDDGTRKYIYGLGLAYAVSGTTVEVYHADRLGSIRALTNGSGAVTTTYTSDAWGSLVGQTGSSTQALGFTGEPRDATGLTYLRARYYDPSLGRMMGRDRWPGLPIAPQTCNRYAYAANNPTTLTDPSGLKAQVLNERTPGCLPAVLAGVFGLVALAPIDALLGAANILVAPSLAGELALLPADAAAIYATGYLSSVVQQGTVSACEDIRLRHPENPFGG